MARKRRWYAHSNSFAAGLLSEAAIDSVDSDLAKMGLGVAENVTILRDGGLRTRPAMQRAIRPDGRIAEPLFQPTHSAIRSKPPFGIVSARVDFETTSDGGRWTGRLFDDGFLEFRRFLRLKDDGVSATEPFFRVRFTDGSRPRSFTFYGAQLITGDWKTTTPTGDALTFEVWVKEAGENPVRNHTEVNDPFERGAFAVGRVARDVVISLDHQTGDPRDLQWIELRVPNPQTIARTTLKIDGFSAYVSERGVPANEPSSADVRALQEGFGSPSTAQSFILPPPGLDSAYRLVPWPVRGRELVLLLMPDLVVYYHVPSSGPPVEVLRAHGAWHFTEQQLAELTHAPFDTDLLLCHAEFPHPLVVSLPQGGNQFTIDYLPLTNVPDVPADQELQAGLTVDVTGGGEIGGPSGAPSEPRGLQVRDGDLELIASWNRANAESYEVMWGLASEYDADPLSWISARGPSIPTAVLPGDFRFDIISTQYEIQGLVAETEYVVAVRSKLGNAWSGIAGVARGTPLAGAPRTITGLTVTAPADRNGGLDISWTADDRAVRYELEWQDPLTGLTRDWTTIETEDTMSVFTGTPGREYSFRVRMVDRLERSSEWSDVVMETATLLALAAPENFVATPTADSAGEIVLTWRDVPEASSYEIRARPDGETLWINLLTTELTLTYIGISGTLYDFEARALGLAHAPSDWTMAIQATAPTPVVPVLPPGPLPSFSVVTDPVRLARVQVRWSPPVVDAAHGVQTGYHLDWRVAGDVDWVRRELQNVNAQLAHVGIAEEVMYEVRMRAVNSGGGGPWTEVLSAESRTGPPERPRIIRITRLDGTGPRTGTLSQGRFELEWAPVDRAESYEWAAAQNIERLGIARPVRPVAAGARTQIYSLQSGFVATMGVRSVRGNQRSEWSTVDALFTRYLSRQGPNEVVADPEDPEGPDDPPDDGRHVPEPPDLSDQGDGSGSDTTPEDKTEVTTFGIPGGNVRDLTPEQIQAIIAASVPVTRRTRDSGSGRSTYGGSDSPGDTSTGRGQGFGGVGGVDSVGDDQGQGPR